MCMSSQGNEILALELEDDNKSRAAAASDERLRLLK